MTSQQSGRSVDAHRRAVRRARARRVGAFAGMLSTLAALVGVRAALTPAQHQALDSSGLAVQADAGVGSGGSVGGPSHAHPARRANGVLVGKPYDVGYGVVQVKVTVAGKQIRDVTPLQLPEGGRSGDISQFAAPQLRREAMAVQSAHIDTVSGASYTSAGYAMSLQSALDQVGR